MLLGVGGPGSGRDFVELILTEGLGRGTDEEVLEVIEVTVRSIGLFLNLAIEDDLDVELAIPLLDFEADEVPDAFFDGIRGGDAVITAGELVEESELSVRINAEGKAYLVDLAPGEGEDPLLSVDFASGLNPAEHGFPDPIEVVFPRVSAEVILCGGFLIPLRVEAVGLIADDGVVLLEAQRSDGVSERALVLNVDGVGEGGAKGVFPAEAGIESASTLDHLIGESPGETGQIAGRRVVVVLALVLVVIAHGHAESEDTLLLEVTEIVIGVSKDIVLGIANPSSIAIRIVGEVGLDAVDRIVELTDLILLVVDVGGDAVSIEFYRRESLLVIVLKGVATRGLISAEILLGRKTSVDTVDLVGIDGLREGLAIDSDSFDLLIAGVLETIGGPVIALHAREISVAVILVIDLGDGTVFALRGLGGQLTSLAIVIIGDGSVGIGL